MSAADAYRGVDEFMNERLCNLLYVAETRADEDFDCAIGACMGPPALADAPHPAVPELAGMASHTLYAIVVAVANRA